jgi:EmrB/QacA subfamily drug resistance transporter
MAFIDGSAVNVALPALQSSLKASLSEVQWVIEAYTLFLGALLLTGGSLGDLFGQRTVFGCGVFVFASASVWCGLAPNIGQLIFARGVQGVGGALLVPASLALLGVSFPREQLGRAIGTWSGATSITSAGGPVLGGWLAQHESWRWVFFLNVPLAAAVLVLVWLRVPSAGRVAGRARIDWLGTGLATAGLGCVVFGFLESSLWVGLVGAVVLGAFLWAEWREKSPMLPLSLFKSRDFSGTGLMTLFLYGALSGALFFFPLDLVQVQGYSETAAGAALLPFILIVAGLSRWSGQLLERYEARLLLILGPLIAGLGFGLFALPGIGGSYWSTFLPAVVVLGLGMAVTIAPLTTTVMNSVGQDRAGIASGVNNAASRVAGLITIALFGTVLAGVFNQRLSASLDGLGVSGSLRREVDAQRSKLAAAVVPIGERRVVEESFVAGFRVVMLLAAGLSFAAAGSSAVFIRRA